MEGTQLLKKEKKDGREEKQALVSHPGSDRAARNAFWEVKYRPSTL